MSLVLLSLSLSLFLTLFRSLLINQLDTSSFALSPSLMFFHFLSVKKRIQSQKFHLSDWKLTSRDQRAVFFISRTFLEKWFLQKWECGQEQLMRDLKNVAGLFYF